MTSLTQQVKIRLEEVARGKYQVFALWIDGSCPLRDGLKAIQAKHEDLFHQALGILWSHLPHRGPRFYRTSKAEVEEISHYGITKINLGGAPDPAVRILWFYDDEDEPAPRAIVCVDAYWKMDGECSGSVPAGDKLPAAGRVKEIYLELKAKDQIQFVDPQGELP